MAAPNEPGFGGHIGRTYRDSTPWWPPLPSGLGSEAAGHTHPGDFVGVLDSYGHG